MIKKILLIAFFGVNLTNAQIIVTPNPFGLTSGTVTLTYGSTGDYSLFDPMSDPNLYLYTGLETDGVASTWDYHDTWTDTNTMVPLTWNPSISAYEATFNIGTRTYFSEATMANTLIPAGTMVNDWYFLIRNADGSRQSTDIQGTAYGFTPATASITLFENGQEIKFYDGKISSTIIGNSSVEIYNLMGQKIKTISIHENETTTLNLNNKGVFVAIISNQSKQKKVKFSN